MKILKMTATFGGLENETLTLTPGLNIITAPNESGKSTWSAFIKAMLYGIDTSQRNTQRSPADKNRYRPWNGSVMKGSMEIEWQGRSITIIRKSRGSNPLADFTAIDTKTGSPVEELNSQNCGQKLLGISREVFESSAFIRQAGVEFGKSGDLEKRLMAMVTTGEDGVSYSEADEFLNRQQNQRRYNRSGKLPALETELAEIDSKLDNIKQVNQKILEQSGKIERLTAEISSLQQELSLIRIRENIEKAAKLEAARKELEQAVKERDQLAAQLSGLPSDATASRVNAAYRAIDALDALEEQVRLRVMEQNAKEAEPQEPIIPPPALKGLDGAHSWEKAQRDTETGQGYRRRMAMKKQPIIILGVAMALALAVLLVSLTSKFIQTYIPAIALGLLAAGLGGFFLWSRNDALRATAELAALLESYGCQKVAGILDAASEYREKLALQAAHKQQLAEDRERVTEAQKDLEAKRTALAGVLKLYAPEAKTNAEAKEILEKRLEVFGLLEQAETRASAAKQILEAIGTVEVGDYKPEELENLPKGDKLKAGASLSRAASDLELARNALAMYTGEQKALGDPAALTSRREELMAEYTALSAEYQAIEVARAVLKEGSDRLQGQFAPAINRRAGEIMEALTGGKYTGVIFDKDMNAMVEDTEDGTPRRANLLSGGTADQLYLAIRLAICQLALPEDDPAPVILDDALVNFDDQRMALAIKLLKKEAETRQVVLFTCHTREQKTAEKQTKAAEKQTKAAEKQTKTPE